MRGNADMPEIKADAGLVAKCGLYCGACGSYLKGKCKGCSENVKATWCTIRSCCGERQIATCAECTDFTDPSECKKFNNFMSKMIGLVTRSDRAACIAQVRELGLEGHAAAMAAAGRQSIRR
jgi:hypothetical protein